MKKTPDTRLWVRIQIEEILASNPKIAKYKGIILEIAFSHQYALLVRW
jgi:outer membrane phospholipase A